MKHSVLLVTLVLSGCATAQAVTPGYQLDPNTRPSCEATCKQMGLELAAVVLVRISAGCVCAVPAAKPAAGLGGRDGGGAVAVAAGALIAEDEAQQFQAVSAQNQQVLNQVRMVK